MGDSSSVAEMWYWVRSARNRLFFISRGSKMFLCGGQEEERRREEDGEEERRRGGGREIKQHKNYKLKQEGT